LKGIFFFYNDDKASENSGDVFKEVKNGELTIICLMCDEFSLIKNKREILKQGNND